MNSIRGDNLPKTNQHRRSFLTKRQRLRTAAVAIALLLVLSLIWLGTRNLSHQRPADWFDVFRQSAVDLFSQRTKDSDAEIEKKQNRYNEFQIELENALHSDELTRLQDFGRPRLNQRISLTMELARDSREDGDLDNALRLLENMALEWQTAVESIGAGLPVEISENDPEGQKYDLPDNSESAAKFEISSTENATVQDSLPTQQKEISETSQFGSQNIVQSDSPGELQINKVEELPTADVNSQTSADFPAAAVQSGMTEATQTSVDAELKKPDSLPMNEESAAGEVEVSGETVAASTEFGEALNELEDAGGPIQTDSLQETEESRVLESAIGAATGQQLAASAEQSTAAVENSAASIMVESQPRSDEGTEVTVSESSAPIQSPADDSGINEPLITANDQLNLANLRTPEQMLGESISPDFEIKSTGSSTNEQFRQEQEKARETYLNFVKSFDEWLASRPADQMLPTGLARTMEKMIEIRNKAEDAYLESDFFSAERLVESAEFERNQFIEREENQFLTAFKAAQTAYQSENYQMAKDAIESAYSLRPNDEGVRDLGNKISMLPDLLTARQDAASARSAGQLTEELAALERVLIYAPQDADAENRMKIIRQQQSDRRFSRAIEQGLAAVGRKDVEGAKSALADARKERSASSSASDLQKKIFDLERQLKMEHNLTAANQAMLQDEWQLALQSFGQVLAIDSQHNDAAQGSMFAKQIIAAQRNVDEFLAQPHRLSSSNIAAAAHKTINEVNYMTGFSPKLSKSINSLKSALVDWTTLVPIRVVSDGETEIGVRGVGIIGKTKERFVELRPGTYVFEGQREGYRSVLVKLVVAAGKNAVPEVSVICSEQI